MTRPRLSAIQTVSTAIRSIRENILHDGAVFAIYSADREDAENSNGRVKFYEKDTVITGSKEFLEAMGAADITPVARPSLPWQVPYNGKYYGTVPAGTVP